MKILIPFTAQYRRWQRIKKHILKRKDVQKRLEAEAREYLQYWQYGFYTPKCLNILRKHYKNFYKPQQNKNGYKAMQRSGSETAIHQQHAS